MNRVFLSRERLGLGSGIGLGPPKTGSLGCEPLRELVSHDGFGAWTLGADLNTGSGGVLARFGRAKLLGVFFIFVVAEGLDRFTCNAFQKSLLSDIVPPCHTQ